MKNEKVRNLWSCLIIGMIVLLCVACDNGDNKRALDYIPVKLGSKWGYVDRKGKWLINPQFDNAGPFYDGRARIQNEREEYAFIDKSGKILNNAWYKDATNFSEGKAWVVAENSAPVLIDTEGKKLFEVKEALHVFPYSEGLATAYVKDEKTGETISGYLDTNGKFDYASSFADGIAFVHVGDKLGFIDTHGKFLVNPQFDAVDMSVVYAYHGINYHMDVAKSDFFDVAYIAERLRDEMKEGSVNGCSPGMTVGAILAKTGLDEGDVCGGGIATNLFYDDAWMSNVSLNLEMKGNYHDSVSDGWWDYVEVLNKDRRPTSLVCTVRITDEEKEDKQPLLFEAVRKAFGATKSNKVGRAGHTFELSSDSEGIHIGIKKIS